MFVGTNSSAGKSLFVTAMCRVLSDRGYRVAPFKSQNMALNSYIDKDSNEFGRAQAIQAFMEGFSSGDNLAAYNIAVNYSLLADAENTKKWLMVIEEKKALDKQICLQGLLADPDMAWFRANQKDWLVTYFRRNCMSFMPPMPAK